MLSSFSRNLSSSWFFSSLTGGFILNRVSPVLTSEDEKFRQALDVTQVRYRSGLIALVFFSNCTAVAELCSN
jgi:hypothetical protein